MKKTNRKSLTDMGDVIKTEIGWEGVDWVNQANDGHNLQAVLNMAIKFPVPYIRGTLPLAEQL